MKALFKFELLKKKFLIVSMILLAVLTSFYLYRLDANYNIAVMILNNENEDDTIYDRNMDKARMHDDSKAYLTNAISLDNYYLENGFYDYGFANGKQYLKNEIAFNQYLLDNHIESLNLVNTVYNNLEKINGVSAVYNVIKTIIPIVLPLLVLGMAYRFFTIKEESYKYLMTLPVSKKQIIKAKWLATMLVSLGLIMFTVLCSFIVGMVIGGIGDFSYPIVFNYLNINNTVHVLNSFAWYLLIVIIMIVFKVIIYTSIGVAIAICFKNKWVSIMLVVMIGIIPAIRLFNLDITMYSDLIPLVFDSSHALVTYGYSLLNIIGYFIVTFIIVYGTNKTAFTLFERREVC